MLFVCSIRTSCTPNKHSYLTFVIVSASSCVWSLSLSPSLFSPLIAISLTRIPSSNIRFRMSSEAHKPNESAPSDPISSNEALPGSGANEERNHSSSEGSDDEDQKIASEQQEVTKRRRTQNARFEALSVLMFCTIA